MRSVTTAVPSSRHDKTVQTGPYFCIAFTAKHRKDWYGAGKTIAVVRHMDDRPIRRIINTKTQMVMRIYWDVDMSKDSGRRLMGELEGYCVYLNKRYRTDSTCPFAMVLSPRRRRK